MEAPLNGILTDPHYRESGISLQILWICDGTLSEVLTEIKIFTSATCSHARAEKELRTMTVVPQESALERIELLTYAD